MKQIQNKWNKYGCIVMISSVCLFCLTVMLLVNNKHLGNQHFMLRAKHAKIGLCEK